MLRSLVLTLGLLACREDPATGPPTGPTAPDPSDTNSSATDSSTPDTAIETADSGQPTLTGPVAIVYASVTCLDEVTVEFYVETTGWTADGAAYEQETANYPPAQWSDSLMLESFEHDRGGAWDHLHHQLRTEVALDEYEPNVNTLFGCHAHYAPSADVMSYAVAVYDATGAVADCVAWGHDPEGMIDGTAGNAVNAPMWDITRCRIGAYDW